MDAYARVAIYVGSMVLGMASHVKLHINDESPETSLSRRRAEIEGV